MLGNYNYNKNFNKGHYFLFSAFKKVLFQIPNAYLLVCGHGSTQDIDRVKQMAFGLNLINNVYFSGFRKDINSIWKHIDILLFSAQAFESFGFAVIEAMAHYVPVVATNVGAIPELIQNEEGGYSVDKKDADSFASHVITLLKNENLRRQQGEKAYLRYQNFFTATKMSKEYYKLLHE